MVGANLVGRVIVQSLGMLRLALLFGVAIVAAASRSQLIGRGLMETAMRNLSRQPAVSIRLVGSEEFAGRQRAFTIGCWFECDPGDDVGPRLECRELDSSGSLVRRFVGDGRTLWFYEATTRRYSAWNYGGYSATPTAGAAARLLSLFRSEAGGPTGWIARLLAEAWGANGARWTEWIPFAQEFLEQGNLTLRSSDLRRNAVFLLEGQGDDVRLTGVRWAQEDVIRGNSRLIRWDAEVRNGADAPGAAFLFSPPTGSTPIARPRSQAEVGINTAAYGQF